MRGLDTWISLNGGIDDAPPDTMRYGVTLADGYTFSVWASSKARAWVLAYDDAKELHPGHAIAKLEEDVPSWWPDAPPKREAA